MLEISDTYVAVVAKQASDFSGVVAVVNVEGALPARTVGAANRAPTVLSFKHPIVLTGRKAVVLFAVVVLEALRVCFSATFLVGGHLWKVLSAPGVVAHPSAGDAVVLEPVGAPRIPPEFRFGLGLPAG